MHASILSATLWKSSLATGMLNRQTCDATGPKDKKKKKWSFWKSMMLSLSPNKCVIICSLGKNAEWLAQKVFTLGQKGFLVI